MRAQKSFLIAFMFLVFGFIASVSLAQQAPDESPTGEAGAGAKLIVTSVSGPATANHNQTIWVTYTVKNQGTVASGAYEVDLYLSTDKTIYPAADRLLKNVTFSTGLLPGQSKKTTTKVLIPINGLSGNYYYGAVIGSSKKASSNGVSLVRYSLTDNNETVTDHQTGLIWQRADDGQIRGWAGAGPYCENLVLGGKADWRLPSVSELETIVEYVRYEYDPNINPVFINTWRYAYWTSSTIAYNPDYYYAWAVFFGGGATVLQGDGGGFVRCVRGGP